MYKRSNHSLPKSQNGPEKKVVRSGQTVQGLGSLVKKHDKVVMERAPGFANLSTNFKL